MQFESADEIDELLVDANEVAQRLGLKSPRAVLDLRLHRLGFPAPVARRGRSLLWSWPQVEGWEMEAPVPGRAKIGASTHR